MSTPTYKDLAHSVNETIFVYCNIKDKPYVEDFPSTEHGLKNFAKVQEADVWTKTLYLISKARFYYDSSDDISQEEKDKNLIKAIKESGKTPMLLQVHEAWEEYAKNYLS